MSPDNMKFDSIVFLRTVQSAGVLLFYVPCGMDNDKLYNSSPL